ncbi:MAG: DUF1211 domain-containing protein [Clostridia bacterium]|nr:DUF1211 domain-containing protein [Clostridia bacterium]
MDKNRFIAITDGILAIAATIMVMRLEPEVPSMEVLSNQWPTLAAYIISFMKIMMAWHEHHDSFLNVKKINHRTFMLNCVWLFFITLLPFVTGMIGNYPDSLFCVLIYTAVIFLCQLTLKVECDYVNKVNNTTIHDIEIIQVIRLESMLFSIVAAAAAILYMPFAGLMILLFNSVLNIVQIIRFDMRNE